MTRSEHLKEQGGYPVGEQHSNPNPSLYSPLIDYGKPDNLPSKDGLKCRKYPIFYHDKTPVGLNTELLTDPYFKNHWKLIPTVVKALNRILAFNLEDAKKKGGVSDIFWRFFHNRFGAQYTIVRDRLEGLGLLTVERDDRGPEQKRCYGYRLTDKCHVLLSDTNQEYLHKLLTDKTKRRRVQKNISERRYRKKVYGDVRDELKATIDGIQFAEKDVDGVCAQLLPEAAAHARYVLIQIEEKNYRGLEHNESDNRIPNPFTHLPADMKPVLTVNGLPYVTTVDIRSAYPSLWAQWICGLIPVITPEVIKEKAAYERIFLDPDTDPKAYLAGLLGISVSEIKQVMLAYFNGKGFRGHVFRRTRPSDPFVKFNTWLKSICPTLYGLWTKTNLKKTGNEIGKNYETKLMLDGSIFEKARSLGLIIGYEYDGFSIYGDVSREHPSIRQLMEYVSEQSVRLLGIKLVIVEKITPKWDLFDVLRKRYEEEADVIYEDWKVFCRRFFRAPANRRDYGALEAEKQKVIEGLKKCVKALERIDPPSKAAETIPHAERPAPLAATERN